MSSTEKPAGKKKRRTASQVGDLLPNVLLDVIARRSGMTIDLLAAWDDIAGPDYAGRTRPEKIRWPRRASEDDPFRPGTLVIACAPEKALFFQHETGEIIDRVNRFFGFEAISVIRIEQRHIRSEQHAPARRPLTAEEEKRLGEVTDKIEDPGLRERLERLGRGVLGKVNKRR
jgi:hypothetical protein